MVGRVLLRPEPVDKPEHLHLSISRKLSNQWGTPQMVVVTELLYETDCLFFIEGRGRLRPRHLYHKWSSK